jgi:oxygen-independent coproporphyrinogen-3 oxidase
LPDDEEEQGFMTYAVDQVLDSGYDGWSSYMFVKDNYMHTYTEDMARGVDHIAYGASAFGKIGNTVYQNINTNKLYKEKIAQSEMPIARSYALTPKDEMVREILLCTKLFSYSSHEFERKYGFSYMNLIPDAIARLRSEDYITVGPSGVKLTRKGIVFGDYVAMVLASSFKNAISPDSISFRY